MMIFKPLRLIVCISIIISSGCATIINDDYQRVQIMSSNGQAFDGTIQDQPFYGPGPINIKRAKEGAIFVTNTKGCTNQTVLKSSLDSAFYFNYLLVVAAPISPFASTTDSVSENMWRYDSTVEIECHDGDW